MKISFTNKLLNDYDTYLFLIKEGKDELPKLEKQLNLKLNKKIRSEFQGLDKQTANIYVQNKDDVYHLILGGIGKVKKNNDNNLCELLRRKTGKCIKSIRNKKATKIVIGLYDTELSHVRSQVEGAILATYQQTLYKTKTKKTPNKSDIQEIVFYHSSSKSTEINKVINETVIICDIINDIRDLINEPANKLNPETYVKFTREYIQKHKLPISIEVINEKMLDKMGMKVMTSVGKGSNPSGASRLVILKYNSLGKVKTGRKTQSKKKTKKGGGSKKKISSKNKSLKVKTNKPLVFVGKGITFDSGGISIKPSKNMNEMKSDMAGSAVVLGTILALAKTKQKVNVISLLSLAENMPGKGATRPGDVVKSYSGKTVEIVNTDAEGRLVLSDTLSYAEKHLNPQVVIDLATLTGFQESLSCGYFSNVMGNNDKLIEDLVNAGNTSGERLMKLPIYPEFNKYLESDVADIQNVSKKCRSGTIIAGLFLSNFISGKTPWVHIDIAGPSWNNPRNEYSENEGSGFGIRLLLEYVRQK